MRCAFCKYRIPSDAQDQSKRYGYDEEYDVCLKCRLILDDIRTQDEFRMKDRFDHLEAIELLKKLPSAHQIAFAYGVAYSMNHIGEGVIPLLQDVAMVNDASLVFAHQNLPHYAEQRRWVQEKYKILEDHRLGQDKEHLRKKLEETRKECEKIEKRIAELEERE